MTSLGMTVSLTMVSDAAHMEKRTGTYECPSFFIGMFTSLSLLKSLRRLKPSDNIKKHRVCPGEPGEGIKVSLYEIWEVTTSRSCEDNPPWYPTRAGWKYFHPRRKSKIKKHKEVDAEFHDTPMAEQFRESQRMWNRYEMQQNIMNPTEKT